MDIQVEERHEQEFKDKRSTQLRQTLLEICFKSWKEYVCENTFITLVIIFRRRASSFQLSRADHYTC